MKHTWSMLCKKASIDSQTNSLSLFDVIEKLTITQNTPVPENVVVPDEIVIPIEFHLVTLISDISKKIKHPVIKITLFNAQNEIMGETENILEVPAGAKSMRSIVMFDAIKIKGEGMYMFKVNLKEGEKEDYAEVANIPLEVEILKAK